MKNLVIHKMLHSKIKSKTFAILAILWMFPCYAKKDKVKICLTMTRKFPNNFAMLIPHGQKCAKKRNPKKGHLHHFHRGKWFLKKYSYSAFIWNNYIEMTSDFFNPLYSLMKCILNINMNASSDMILPHCASLCKKWRDSSAG